MTKKTLKPVKGDFYYYLGESLQIYKGIWYKDFHNKELYELGNFFWTEEDAKEAAEKIKQLLKEIKENEV